MIFGENKQLNANRSLVKVAIECSTDSLNYQNGNTLIL